jgi:hypothetical protein
MGADRSRQDLAFFQTAANNQITSMGSVFKSAATEK